jgi:protein O-mannosyl-transferase
MEQGRSLGCQIQAVGRSGSSPVDSRAPAANRQSSLRHPADFAWVLLVFGATLLVYFPALRGGFIWDDDHHVPTVALQSWHGLWRIWFELGSTQQYYPILFSAFWAQHRLWGEATLGYHLFSVLCHATSAWLFALVLRRIFGSALRGFEWFGALLFALHPVCVESVAWISEQKNTLSTVFYLLAALAYLRFDRDRRRPAYWLATGFFVLALLSKTVTATLPAALLVVGWWRRGRWPGRQDAVPLLPWFGLGAAAGLFSGWVERTYVGAQGGVFELSLAQRCLVAGREIWFYLGKLLWPANLIFIYPRWTVNAAEGWQWLYPIAALALLAVLWAIRGRSRGPLAALLFFVGTLFPTLGFFNIYAFIYSYVTDHWQYLASLGIIALAAGAWARWAWGPDATVGRRETPRGLSLAAASLLLGGLGVLSWRQSRMYRDIDTFYRTTIAENPGCWLAHNNLANRLLQAGKVEEAIEHYEAAARLDAGDPEALDNLGVALASGGKAGEAIASFHAALGLRPDFPKAHYNLGLILAAVGRLPEAGEQYQAAVRENPRYAEAYNNLGVIQASTGRPAEAAASFAAALQLLPDYSEAHNNLGLLLAGSGRFPEAIAEYRTALRLDPRYPDAYDNLGIALASSGRNDEAMASFRAALQFRPDFIGAHYNLSITLRAAGRSAEADAELAAARRLRPAPGPPQRSQP